MVPSAPFHGWGNWGFAFKNLNRVPNLCLSSEFSWPYYVIVRHLTQCIQKQPIISLHLEFLIHFPFHVTSAISVVSQNHGLHAFSLHCHASTDKFSYQVPLSLPPQCLLHSFFQTLRTDRDAPPESPCITPANSYYRGLVQLFLWTINVCLHHLRISRPSVESFIILSK